jgi:hypothetical protein
LRVLFRFQQTNQFCGGVRQACASARNQIHVSRQIQLPDFDFFHPAAIDLLGYAHARHNGYAHAHLYEALDTFDGGHFDRHIQSGVIAAE